MQLRRSLCPALVLSACAHTPVAPVVPAEPPPTEAMIESLSHELLDAYDRGDHATLDRLFAPGFVMFEYEHLRDRDKMLERSTGKPPHPPKMTRTWKEQHVYLRDHDAVFIGMAAERETGNEVHGNREYSGWYTMSWIRDHGAWKASHWTWEPHQSDIENARAMWNDTFRQGVGFEHKPNRLLVDTVRGLTPGTALDVMTGQGRNALYLASQGWKVTGIDISDEGLRLAREAAAAQHVELQAVQADVKTYEFGVAKWDLVTMIYAGSSTDMIEKIKKSIKPGGKFILEFFAARPGENGTFGGFKDGQLAGLFADGFTIERDEMVEDVPDWAENRARLVRFVARKR
ncbi:MAG TPA: methyltransferase domain-containing protein [Kofleriaceae bacterium]|nr:methyltransferase domain-containing protein [Kofleriaceae bacterium]